MVNDGLGTSWKRTEGYLPDARSHLSEPAEGVFADEIYDFEGFLEHNEFELALDTLEVIFEKSPWESWRVLELMALAAASMGLSEQQCRYDDQLSKARGWKYEAVLPN